MVSRLNHETGLIIQSNTYTIARMCTYENQLEFFFVVLIFLNAYVIKKAKSLLSTYPL